MAYSGYQGYTPPTAESVRRRREIADALSAQAMDTSPKGLGEGFAQIGQALLARRSNKRMEREEQEGQAAARAQIEAILSGQPAQGGGMTAPGAPGQPQPATAAPGMSPGASPSGFDPRLIGAMDNPYASEGQRSVLNALMERQAALAGPVEGKVVGNDLVNPYDGSMIYESNDPLSVSPGTRIIDPQTMEERYAAPEALPTSVQEFQFGQGTPEYNAWALQQKQAGADRTSINLAENAYDSKIGAGMADAYMGYQDQARTAQSAIATLDTMDALMADPAFYSGAGGEQVMQLKRAAVALGGDPDQVSSMETFNALSKAAALDVMGGSLGAGFSNADRDFVIDQVSNIGSTPQSNMQLNEIQRQIQRRKIEIGSLAQQYATQNGGRLDSGFDQYLSQWAAEHPVFVPAPASGLPEGVSQDLWDVMTPEERAAFQ